MPRSTSARRAWLPALAFAALILGVSSIPARSMPEAQSLWRLDKLVHALEYAVLATLVHRALRMSRAGNLFFLALVSAVGCALFGGLDELYQSTVPGRDSSPLDALADLVGASFASIMSAVFYSRQRSTHGYHSQL